MLSPESNENMLASFVSPEHANAIRIGTEYNNQALQASYNGDFTTAERLHLEAIKVKESGMSTDAVGTAISYNAIGELYLEMKKLDKAEEYLLKAVAIRNVKGYPFDGAVSRENLAQLEELKGNLPKAKEIRLSGAPDKLACGYSQCAGQMFKLSDLKHCSRCKAVYYCSVACQTNDWKRRHKPLCKAA